MLPREFKRHVSVKEEFGLIKIQVDSGTPRCFVGSNMKEHAEEALQLALDIIDMMRREERERRERKTLAIAQKRMATRLPGHGLRIVK